MNQIISTAAPAAIIILLTIFAIPSYIALLRQRGFGRGIAILLLLIVATLGLESLMVQFHLPTQYSYNNILGYRLLGLVPIALIGIFPPIFLGGFWLTSKRSEGFMQILQATLFSTAGVAVVGAALSRMNLIDWASGGILYSVPVIAMVGWVILSFVSSMIISKLWGDDEPPIRTICFSAVGILLFWAGVNLGLQQWAAGGIGVALAILCIVIGLIEKRNQLRDKNKKA